MVNCQYKQNRVLALPFPPLFVEKPQYSHYVTMEQLTTGSQMSLYTQLRDITQEFYINE